jgi:hypothetical protein
MKKIAGLLLCGGLLFKCFSVQAQTFAESALLFGRTQPGGSARIQGMGGAQVSLGGDYSSAYSNPGGLGMFNHSEVAVSPGYNFSNSSSSYLNSTTPGTQSNLNFQGLGVVIHHNKDNGKLRGTTFGITMNRTNDFNRTVVYNAVNPNSSIIDYFVNDANAASTAYGGLGPSQLFYNATTAGPLYETPTRLAYDQYLIDKQSAFIGGNDSTHYNSPVPANPNNPVQHEIVQTTGSQYQINLSYAVNLDNKVFLGLGIGLAAIDYQITRTYTETFPQLPLNSLSFGQTLGTSTQSSLVGGINGTLGGIYRPVDFFQFGLSIATPTYYSLTDTYDAALATNWNTAAFNSIYPGASVPTSASAIDEQTFSYNLTTPWRYSGGVTFFILKYGFITADLEYDKYGGSRYSGASDGSSFAPDNQDIQASYRSVLNKRIGAEYRLKKFRFRAGYSVMPDPYKTGQNNIDSQIQSFSVGAGYRANKYYIDLAGIQRTGTTSYIPYNGASQVISNNTINTIMVTFGYFLRDRR